MTRRSATALLAVLFLAACGTDDAGDPPPIDQPAPPAEAPAQPAETVTADFGPLDGSGIDGFLTVDASGDQAVITVSLSNAPEGVYQGHVHGGTCADRTRAITPLEPVSVGVDGSGSSVSTVDMAAETLLDGNHIVVYHEAGGSPGASVTCAEIPQRQ
ncbi:MAG TPA: hypothetical protein VK929_08415 [Longimicrobiales bacterium]|nr:hypothetical protein [Longimicrobiales bacterium]